MQVDVLIIGQGICGTMLSWFLHKEGKSFALIDNANPMTSSKVAAGIINPVTGRRYVTTWMIEDVMPFAKGVYEEISSYLDTTLIQPKSVIDFFPSPQMLNAIVERVKEDDTYLHPFPDQNHFNQYFNYDFGCGEIKPAYIVHFASLLTTWRKILIEKKVLLERDFLLQELEVNIDSVQYNDIKAAKIVFCEGIIGTENPWFNLLPFAPNKGEALIIECEGLTNEHIFKRGLTLAPLSTPHYFWVGSNYQWEFSDDQPSEAFYKSTTQHLTNWLRKPYKVLEHKAAIRPATLERRPFVGFHPYFPNIGILNGMGTKGASLAPYFANQLAQHIVHGLPIAADADVKRFSRILSRQ
ncbi:MAG: FAD-dependent oxidoreductase [Flaviaesturariibacter sp.]|nr:FAD-dependent oxidoreductase [Flaviaesturariibacter sp.]